VPLETVSDFPALRVTLAAAQEEQFVALTTGLFVEVVSMTTSSLEVGTTPVDQFAATPQSVLAAPVHVSLLAIAAAGMTNNTIAATTTKALARQPTRLLIIRYRP
jgi:hypothetical protein